MHVNYSEYLGPDWKPSFENPSTVISNHQCFMDIICHMYRQPPSHVSKAGVFKLPFVGYLADVFGCLFIDRGNKDQKKDLLEQIVDRQIECEKGVYPPLILYPEGGTTNGTHLINFKKGAFVGLRSIQPFLIEYNSPFLNIENCIFNFFAQSVLCATSPYTSVTISELPVF